MKWFARVLSGSEGVFSAEHQPPRQHHVADDGLLRRGARRPCHDQVVLVQRVRPKWRGDADSRRGRLRRHRLQWFVSAATPLEPSNIYTTS